jgi:hypothetical protein
LWCCVSFFSSGGKKFLVLCTYLVYNTVVQLCQFFCFGGKANLVRLFLLNPNFLLIHRNKYSEGMEDGQKNPRGYPDYLSYVKLNVFHIPDIFLVNTLLLDSLSPYSQTEGQTETQIHSLRVGWRNLFSSCAVVSCQFLVLAGNRFWFTYSCT